MGSLEFKLLKEDDNSIQVPLNDTANTYQNLVNTYKLSNSAIEVDFRKLVDWVPYSDSETHYIHAYPAKLLKHIPIFFLNAGLVDKDGTVLDPFCGTGTVLLEAIKEGFNSIGTDANPVARLIAKVKTTPLKTDRLRTLLSKILSANRSSDSPEFPNVTNIDLWFSSRIKNELHQLKGIIEHNSTGKYKDFFNVCFSNILKKVSVADPNLSVPVRLKPEKYKKEELRIKANSRLNALKKIDVFGVFNTQVLNNISRMDKLLSNERLGGANIIGRDAKDLRFNFKSGQPELPDNSVDFIITSPPYAGAQKYVRASSFSLGWLGFCDDVPLRSFESESIGREHYSKSQMSEKLSFDIDEIDSRIQDIYEVNPLRAHINGNYLLEMSKAISEMYRVLKEGAYCVIVMGNNEVCGKAFNTQKYINLLAEKFGFTTELKLVDNIHSRGLMTKRNKTASIINSEWIMVLKK